MNISKEFKFSEFEEKASNSVKITDEEMIDNLSYRDLKIAEAELKIAQTEYFAVKYAYACASQNPESKFEIPKDPEGKIFASKAAVDKMLSWEKVDNIICGVGVLPYLKLSPNFVGDGDDRLWGIYNCGSLTDHDKKVIKIYKAPTEVLPRNGFIYYFDGIFIKGKLG